MEQWLINLLIGAGVVIGLLVVFLIKNQLGNAVLSILERFLRGKSRDNLTEHKEQVSKPVGWIIFAAIAMAALSFIPQLPPRLIVFLWRVLNSLLLGAVAYGLFAVTDMLMSRVIQDNIKKHEHSERGDSRTALSYLSVIIKAIILIFAILMILEQWMDNVQSLLAGLGIGGIALALAAQDTAANLISGLAILLDKPFDIGDWVETETGSGDVAGSVEHIGLRSSRVRATDGSLLTVPNSIMGSSVIVNGTKRPIRFVSSLIPVSNDTTSAQLADFRAKVQEILDNDEGVVGSGTVHFTSFERDAYILELRYNTSSDFGEWNSTRTSVNTKVLAVLEEIGIEVADVITVETNE